MQMRLYNLSYSGLLCRHSNPLRFVPGGRAVEWHSEWQEDERERCLCGLAHASISIANEAELSAFYYHNSRGLNLNTAVFMQSLFRDNKIQLKCVNFKYDPITAAHLIYKAARRRLR